MIFEITQTIPRTPPVHKLKDFDNDEIKGVFYEDELQKVFDTGFHKIHDIFNSHTNKKGNKITLSI